MYFENEENQMHIIYSLEEPPQSFSKSIFLAGPTPRSPETKSWRPEALELLRKNGYDGVVFVPENRKGQITDYDYGDYPAWEQRMMDMSDLILFWVPRKLKKLPAFTTNVEFGLYANSGKALFGPPNGTKNRYLSFVANKLNIEQFIILEDMVKRVIEILGPGDSRKGGEKEIPLSIWKLRAFQNWYKAQLLAGNRLDGASIEWISRVRNKPSAIFAFALRPKVYISSEDRTKLNDPVIFRLDISSAVLYKRRPDLLNSEIVIIREFRSAASTADGFIWELPGGSSPSITDPLKVVIEEIKEEVGLDIEQRRLKHVGSRQMAGTLSAHKSHTYSAELTDQELDWLRSQKDIPHGTDYPDNPTGERAYTEILTIKELLENSLTDWSNIGMILSVVR